MNSSALANRPAASVTDEEVASVIAVMAADSRVSSLSYVGRDQSGRPVVNIAMGTFVGEYSLGRAINEFGMSEQQARKSADASREAARKELERKRRADEKLLAQGSPRLGQNEEFDDWAEGVEADLSGVVGELTDNPLERARLYSAFLDYQKAQKSAANKQTGAAAAAKTRAKNAEKGVSQKNLTGSTKQKRWASEIRGKMIAGFGPENQKFLLETSISSSFWISYRDMPSKKVSDRLDHIYKAMTDAIEAREAYASANQTAQGVLITTEYSDLRDTAGAAKLAWNRLLDGKDTEFRNW